MLSLHLFLRINPTTVQLTFSRAQHHLGDKFVPCQVRRPSKRALRLTGDVIPTDQRWLRMCFITS
jgi:hypothetical protein